MRLTLLHVFFGRSGEVLPQKRRAVYTDTRTGNATPCGAPSAIALGPRLAKVIHSENEDAVGLYACVLRQGGHLPCNFYNRVTFMGIYQVTLIAG